MAVAFMVFCFFLPDTNARRPPRLAGGRRTWISVASNRNSMPSAWCWIPLSPGICPGGGVVDGARGRVLEDGFTGTAGV